MRIDIQEGVVEELDRMLETKDAKGKSFRIHVAGIG